MAWYSKFYDSTGVIEIGGVQLPACSWFGKTPPDEYKQYAESMEQAEESGELEGLFKCKCKAPELPTKQSFKDSFSPSMRLTKRTFLNILAYDISTPGDAEEMLTVLEQLGCSKAREHYAGVKAEYEREHEEVMKNTAEWYRKQKFKVEKVMKPGKGSDRNWKKQQEAEQLMRDLHQKSDKELLSLLQTLREENEL